MKTIFIYLIFLISFSNSAFAMSSLEISFDLEGSDSSSSDSSSSDSSSSDSSSSDSSSSDSSSSDKNKSETLDTTLHFKASCARNVAKPKLFRETASDYFSTHIGVLINAKSLKEFFNITNNQYDKRCESWYRQYFNSQFHKALVFAYDPKDISQISSYWGFSYNSSSSHIAEKNALKACKNSSEKKESHICEILFSNNQIVNVNYLTLANQPF